MTRTLRRGYYAAVSWCDFLVGELLDAAGDDVPSRLPRARDSGAATAADTPVSSDRGLGGFVGGDDRT